QGREEQRVGIQLPMMRPPFGSLGLPPGPVQAIEKAPANWGLPKIIGILKEKALGSPSRAKQNDYSQNFVDPGKRPNKFTRELELIKDVEEYLKLWEHIKEKKKTRLPSIRRKCSSSPWCCQPYGLLDICEVLKLKSKAIGDTPSFIFLWVGVGVGLEQGPSTWSNQGIRADISTARYLYEVTML
ncbi:hypothetical protein C5167_048146, partial [Papaver somniferum]